MRTKLEAAVDTFLRDVGAEQRPLPDWVVIYFIRLRSALRDPERNAPATIHQPIYDPDHPLVRCPDCSQEYTACDLGNHYCPSCGESSEGALLALCAGCPCTESGGEPCCWCGGSLDAHLQRVP